MRFVLNRENAINVHRYRWPQHSNIITINAHSSTRILLTRALQVNWEMRVANREMVMAYEVPASSSIGQNFYISLQVQLLTLANEYNISFFTQNNLSKAQLIFENEHQQELTSVAFMQMLVLYRRNGFDQRFLAMRYWRWGASSDPSWDGEVAACG